LTVLAVYMYNGSRREKLVVRHLKVPLHCAKLHFTFSEELFTYAQAGLSSLQEDLSHGYMSFSCCYNNLILSAVALCALSGYF